MHCFNDEKFDTGNDFFKSFEERKRFFLNDKTFDDNFLKLFLKKDLFNVEDLVISFLQKK